MTPLAHGYWELSSVCALGAASHVDVYNIGGRACSWQHPDKILGKQIVYMIYEFNGNSGVSSQTLTSSKASNLSSR